MCAEWSAIEAAHAEEVKSLVEGLEGVFDPERPVEQGDALKGRLAAAIAGRTAREGLEKRIAALSEEIAERRERPSRTTSSRCDDVRGLRCGFLAGGR